MEHFLDLSRLCPPPVRYAPPVLEHVPLHGKSLCKDLERASVGANNMRPLSWGGAQTENIPFFTAEIYFAFTANNIIDTFISTERHYFCFRFQKWRHQNFLFCKLPLSQGFSKFGHGSRFPKLNIKPFSNF